MGFWRAARKVGIAGGLAIVLLSAVAFNALLPHRSSRSARIAVVLALPSLGLGWAVLVGAVARKRNWSTYGCYKFASASLTAIGIADVLVLSCFTPIRIAGLVGAFVGLGSLVGPTARKIAFPELKFAHQELSQLTILHLN